MRDSFALTLATLLPSNHQHSEFSAYFKFAQDEVPGNKLTYYVRCEQGKQRNKGPVFIREGYLLRFYRGSRPWPQLLIKRFDLLVIQSECYFSHQFFLPRAHR